MPGGNLSGELLVKIVCDRKISCYARGVCHVTHPRPPGVPPRRPGTTATPMAADNSKKRAARSPGATREQTEPSRNGSAANHGRVRAGKRPAGSYSLASLHYEECQFSDGAGGLTTLGSAVSFCPRSGPGWASRR